MCGAVSDSVELSSEEEDSDEEDDIEPRAQSLVLVFHFQNQMILKRKSGPRPQKLVTEPEQRCEQKKLELKISSGLKKAYARMRTVQTAGPATSLAAAASERQELLQVTLTQKWPD